MVPSLWGSSEVRGYIKGPLIMRVIRGEGLYYWYPSSWGSSEVGVMEARRIIVLPGSGPCRYNYICL